MKQAYLDFVVDRHSVWAQRQNGLEAPWTGDPILAARKFTNVFRVLDAGSQFLLKELLNDPTATALDAVMRSYLYRITNRPDAWVHFKQEHGRYPQIRDLSDGLVEHWLDFRKGGGQVFSGAYIIRPEPTVKGVDKVYSVVKMAYNLFNPESSNWIGLKWLDAQTMQERFDLLKAQPGIGDFIAMQVLTDYGYSRYGADQDENSFIVPGPGAINGALELFPDKRAKDVIYWARAELLELEERCPTIEGRPPSLMDVQNTLCEFSKYARYLRAEPKFSFYQATPGAQPTPTLPEHWSII